jgi:hypothetical protein
MFVRLTRPARARAGWFAALLYLFCVLAPGAALALGDAVSCLTMPVEKATNAPMHNAPIHNGSAHQHHQAHGDHHADAGAVNHEPAEPQHHGNASLAPCCAVLCVSAIAADLPAVATPSQPISLCVSGNFQRLPSKAPPLLYRPPIA